MAGERRGRGRELRVADRLRADGWVAYRLAWGHADVLALRYGEAPQLIQVKSTAGGPYERFAPADRAALLREARRAGATAWLAWWPKGRPLTWVPSTQWPGNRRTAGATGPATSPTPSLPASPSDSPPR